MRRIILTGLIFCCCLCHLAAKDLKQLEAQAIFNHEYFTHNNFEPLNKRDALLGATRIELAMKARPNSSTLFSFSFFNDL